MSVTLNTSGLQQFSKFVRDLQENESQVGIFKSRDYRTDGKSNATIGAQHEFGLVSEGSKMPERSFLRMPLLAMVIDPASIRPAAANADAVALLETLGNQAEEKIAEAFDTGGFGQWPSLHHTTVAEKGNDVILIDSGQLRSAVGSRVAPQGSGR